MALLSPWSVRHRAGGGELTITGTPGVGETLTVRGAPSDSAYLWRRDGVAITGAYNPAYTVQSADQGHDLICQASALSNTLSVPAAPLPDELFPGWAPGRTFRWSDDPTLSNADFEITNYALVTDGGQAALQHAAGHEFDPVSILTAATDLAAARVEVLYRAQPASGLSIGNINLQPTIRLSDASNHWRVERTFQDGAAWLQPIERIAGADHAAAVFGGDTALDDTDTTHYQRIVTDVFWDVIRAKTWFISDSEPGWKGKLRLRPITGAGGAGTTTDDNTPETGQAGLQAMYGGIIQDIIVTELLPTSSNLFLNAELDAELMDDSGRPFFWDFDARYTDQTTGICEVTTATLPDGSTGPVLRVARDTSGSEGGGPMWQADQYLTDPPTNNSYARQRPIPSVGAAFPSTPMPQRMWTKGINVADSGPLSIPPAAIVNYYPAADGTGLNVTHNDYYTGISPDPTGAVLGTWDWFEFEFEFTMHNADEAVRNLVSMGFHNDTTTGEMLIYLPGMFLS